MNCDTVFYLHITSDLLFMTDDRMPVTKLIRRVVPGGWKVIALRRGTAVSTFYLSPDGKRFASLLAVKAYVKAEEQKKRMKRKRQETFEEIKKSEPVSKKLKLDDKDSEDDQFKAPPSISLPLEIQRRRKVMMARNPYRNLLKKVLARNHEKLRGKMIPAEQKSFKRTAGDMEDNTAPDSKRQRTSQDSTPKRTRTSYISPSTKIAKESLSEEQTFAEESLSKERKTAEEQVTPPRPMFPPPNLTPPVRRPVSRLSFESPNMRSVASRVRLTQPLNQANSPLKRDLF